MFISSSAGAADRVLYFEHAQKLTGNKLLLQGQNAYSLKKDDSIKKCEFLMRRHNFWVYELLLQSQTAIILKKGDFIKKREFPKRKQ